MSKLHFRLLLAIAGLTAVVVTEEVCTSTGVYDHTRCYSSDRGMEYQGNVAKTRDNIPCQRWDADEPHQTSGTASNVANFPDDTLEAAANYCRNPSNHYNGPWCYTTDPNIAWQHCDVPHCFGYVDRVDPRKISTSGNVLVTISGKGFANSQFNFGTESHVGNKVWLVNEYNSFECDIHKDGTTDEMIQCYTKSNMMDDDYTVRLSVDGVCSPESALCNGDPSAWHCKFKARDSYNPYITSVEPRTGPVDQIITITGTLWTDLYGSLDSLASNGRTEKIRRILVLNQNCDLKDGDDFYGIGLTSYSTGFIKCKLSTLKVPAMGNVSLTIGSPFGKAATKSSALHVFGNSQLYTFQSYAEIESISPASGSTVGGQLITITGRSFDVNSDPVVTVGTQPCTIESVTATQILCRAPAENGQTRVLYSGNRGVNHDIFYNERVLFDDLETIQTKTNPETKWTDGMTWCEGEENCQIANDQDDYSVRSKGFLRPAVTGGYRFSVSCDDSAKIYLSTDSTEANKVLIIDCPSQTSKTYKYDSDIIQLVAGEEYFMQALSSEYASGGYMNVGARLYNTQLVQRQSGKVEPANHEIKMTSTVEKEVLKITTSFTDQSSRDGVKEVQEVTVTYQTDGGWQLGMFGIYTDVLDMDTDSFKLEEALTDVLSPFSERVSVTLVEDEVENSVTFQVEFLTADDWPLLSKKDSGSFGVTVTEKTQGVASLSSWRLHLEHDGVDLISDRFTTFKPTADVVKENMESMFEVKCPGSIREKAYGEKYYNGYDDKDTESEPFCGMGSGKNIEKIFSQTSDPIDFSSNGYMCFAYRGTLKNSLRIQIATGSSGTETIYPEDVQFNSGLDWSYTCIDVLAQAKAALPDENQFKLKEFELDREPYDDYWVDEVVFTSKETSGNVDKVASEKRIPVSIRLDKLTVTEVGDANAEFDVKITPHHCSNDFKMMQMFLAPKLSGSTGTGSMSVTYGDTTGVAWPADASVTIDRVTTASPPVTGKWSLTYDSKSIEYEADMTEDELKFSLSQNFDFTEVRVDKEGSCYGYTYNLEFTQTTENIPDPTVADVSLQGRDAAIEVISHEPNVFYDPIPGHMMSTSHSTPQVRVEINEISSRCNGDCSYTWSADNTPTLTSVAPTSGGNGATLTITGDKFSTTPSDNMVEIGGASCDVTASTATEITCTLGNGPIGTFPVKVTVKEHGLADGSATFAVDAGEVTSVAPTTGSAAGGTKLTITGLGFDSTATVTIGGVACPIIGDVTPAVITCLTPASAETTALDVVVVVDSGATPLTKAAAYTYDPANTPTVTSFTPATVTPVGGETLAITGTGFVNAESVEVNLIDSNDKKTLLVLTASSTDDTTITATIPSLPAGDYEIEVSVADVGYPTFSGSNILKIAGKVTGISTHKGSFEGGTRLAIAGEGFGTNKTVVDVMIGDTECEIENIADDMITCYTGRGSKTVVITNNGIDPEFGLGYAWNPVTVEIKTADRVKFQWVSPPFVTSNKFKVMQAPSETGEPDGTGFDSGEGSYSGHFIHQFDTAGTFFFTTDRLGPLKDIELRGKVIVTDKAAFAGDVTVTVGGQLATNEAGALPTEAVACAGSADAITSCTETDVLTGTEKFKFAYMLCHTPEVTSQDVQQGDIDTAITIAGTGFSTTACENEVTIGDYKCVPTSQTAVEIVCKMDANETPDVGVSYDVNVRVNNRGNAIIAHESSTFALLSSISDVTPTSGSTHGGTLITITGAGFMGDVTVTIGGNTCEYDTFTYTEIICTTPVSSGSNSVAIDVVVTSINSVNSPVPAACADGGACTFTYEVSATPTLTAVTTSVDGKGGELVISGTGLGTDTNNVKVMVGTHDCTVTAVADDQVTCNVSPLPAGDYKITVDVTGKGAGQSIDSEVISLVVDSITPTSGSVYGGQLVTISGGGFSDVEGVTQVTINTKDCQVQSATPSEVVCLTSASDAAADTTVSVDVGFGTADTNQVYTYDESISPKVTSLDVTNGVADDIITITGTGFVDTKTTVKIGGSSCTVSSTTDTTIVCQAGAHAPGIAMVVVDVEDVGYSNGDTEFTYDLKHGSVTPIQGSFGGGQQVTVEGSGFVDGVKVTLCDVPCEIVSNTPTQIVFTTPSMEESYHNVDSKQCQMIIAIEDKTVTIDAAFTFLPVSTPIITNVEPTRGGTKGGTTLTITGENFSASDNTVTIAGTACAIQTQSDTEIVCLTGEPGATSKTVVVVTAGTLGNSLARDADFWYVDVWSSIYTWGGGPLPTEGDFIVVKEGQIVLLDQDTPVLKMLLIQGGELVFDEKDITLKAENILIVSGGKLTVGTEEKPFQHNAVIEMHGQLRAPELPIYGAKCLAVREGELNLHGKPLRMTWTHLEETAAVGATQIKLQWGQADWPVGATIAIATTGDRHSQKETELRVITAVSADGKTIDFAEALEYEHLGVEEVLGGSHKLQMRAEVAILSRNVRVIGTRDQQWSDDIEECEEGFDTGEFATQTCFQGRFGDEVGSDQFGAQIMFHAPVKDEKLAVGKLSYIEVNYAGQAFRLGRYPIHFHLNGDMSGSYVRGLAIHETFNRAVNIHGTHNVLVEHTVIYNVMGGAFFLEDGIETGNRYYYNLALFVKASTSLLNDDITPAAFWATNPANHYEHNAVAGGTHFGWWYRLLEHPEGPSATTDYCPRKVPLGTCNNNTVHSNGWFGLWTFQDYYPMKDGTCGSTEPEPAVFRRFIVWNCEKGLEFVNGGSLQFVDCLLANNKLAGVEGKRTMKLGDKAPYSDQGPMIKDSVIASYVPNHPQDSGGERFGVILPWSEGYSVKNTVFINFDKKEEVVFGMTTIQGTCSELCGAYNYHVSGLTFINGDQHLAKFRWLHDGVFYDLDGSFTGTAGSKALAMTGTLDMSKCTEDSRFTGVTAAVCDATTDFARVSFNNPNMDSMLYKDVIMANSHGEQRAFFADKRMTHKTGWTAVVQKGETYKVYWEHLEHITNLSYSIAFYGMENNGIVFTHNISTQPDRVGTTAGVRDFSERADMPLNYADNNDGDFYYNSNEKELSYLVSDKVAGRRKREAEGATFITKAFTSQVIKCQWPDCTPPPDQNSLPPVDKRPEVFKLWSSPDTWPNSRLPEIDDAEVIIAKNEWVVADIEIPRLKTLLLYGNLELDNQMTDGKYKDYTLELDFLIIMGGRLVVGFKEDIYRGNTEIILNGDVYSDPYEAVGTPVGQKAIAVYGGLDLHGIGPEPIQTTLKETANAQQTQITVSSLVKWKVGDKIVISSTTYDSSQTEVFKITAVNDYVITLDGPLLYKHLGVTLTDESGNEYGQAAEVAVLNRNIVVRGGDHTNLIDRGFGGRILVSATVDDSEDESVKRSGFARITNTHFINMGQYGYTNDFDPRYAIAYVGTGDSGINNPSVVSKCTFDMGFSPAVGLFGANNIEVNENVMYRVVGGGMVVQGSDHKITKNLIMLNAWPGTYNGRKETKNVAYEASFDLVKAGDITFTDNIAAGSERAGFRIGGHRCDGSVVNWKNNKVHSSMFGVMMWEGDQISAICFRVQGFTAWKNFDFGIFIQTPANRVELEDNNLIENGLGLWTHTFGPGSLSHTRVLKSVLFKGGFVSGATSSFDCDVDVKPSTTNYGLSSLARSWRIGGKGLVGISMPNADGGPNGLPTHPFIGRMSYPTIDARMDIEGTTFANFGTRTCGSADVNDFAITTNPTAEDINHPLYIKEATVDSTALKSNRVYFHRSNVRAVNPSDCVDMDCDGHKKAVLQDMDGTFLIGTTGNPATMIDDASYEWDGDPRYGLGDYRIPKVMLTFPNSTRFDPPLKKGLYRTSDCTYIDTSQAYECKGIQYRLLVIESMDADTEVRRLSPIGVKARTDDGGYIDLLNGPQDHGWCAGYTCQKRISTFWTVVADGVTFDIYMTGTNPQKTRFYMLQAEDEESVRLAVYYFSPQRLDVFTDDIYVYPTNAEITGDGNYNLKPSTQTPSEHLPPLTASSGQNFFDREWQLQYLIIKGTSVVDVIIKQVVVVSLSLPPMTIDDFFGENIINNLATFLGVPANKIRIVEIVSENSGRRKRAEAGTVVNIEIGDPPSAGGNSSDVNSGDMNRDALLNVTRQVVDAVQLGTLGNSLNLTIVGIDVQEPLPEPENSTSSTWATLTNNDSEVLAVIQIPSKMVYTTQLVADREQQPFPTQPSFAMYDAADNLVEILGSRQDPWKIRAILVLGAGANSDAKLIGETVCGFKDGYCTFETLGISHSGSGYSIDFEIFDPAEATYSASSSTISVREAELTAGFTQIPPKDSPVVTDEPFTVQVDIRDLTSLMRVEDITWKGNSWNASLSINNPSLTPNATLNGTLEVQFDAGTGLATFNNLTINQAGRYSLNATVTSGSQVLTGRSTVMEVKANKTMQVEEVSYKFTLRLHADYSTYVDGKADLFEASVYNYLLSIDDTMRYHDFAITNGSIYVEFWASGETASMTNVIDTVASNVNSSLPLATSEGTIEFDTFLKLDDTVHSDLIGQTTTQPTSTSTTTLSLTTTGNFTSPGNFTNSTVAEKADATSAPKPKKNLGAIIAIIVVVVFLAIVAVAVTATVIIMKKKESQKVGDVMYPSSKTAHSDAEGSEGRTASRADSAMGYPVKVEQTLDPSTAAAAKE